MSILNSAADVLRCFDSHHPELGVMDVADLLGAPKSSISRLLRAMREAGLLDAVANSRRYRPGVLLMEVGQLTRMHSTLLAAAERLAAALVKRFGHTGYVSALEGREVSGLSYHQGSNLIHVGTPVGDRLPAAAAATGRALLARMSDPAVLALYADGYKPVSDRAPRDLDDLLARLQQVRDQGIAWASNETNAGIESLAAAIGNPATGEALALCLVYPTGAADPAARAAMEAAMRDGIADIARAFGDPLAPVPQGVTA